MEDVLVLETICWECDLWGLNPCCSGRCSSTRQRQSYSSNNAKVLILVVVEDVLVPSIVKLIKDLANKS